MPYLFTCPHCQARTQVPDRYSGQAGQCVTCGGDIHLPHFASEPVTTSQPQKEPKTLGWVAAALVSVILLGALLLAVIRFGGQTVSQLSSSRQRTSSIQNLEKIADALNAYAADHGTYPPSFTRDASGTKLHSWRVLILPYLGEEELYDQFDLNLPWDHSANTAVAAYNIPAVYQHPTSSASGTFYVSAYYLITGPGTLFPASGPLRPDQITDDATKTILVIEGTPLITTNMWTEPIDLDFTRMQGKLGTNPGIEPGGLLDDGVAMATADGRGHFLANSFEPSTFRALVTPGGGERLADDTLD